MRRTSLHGTSVVRIFETSSAFSNCKVVVVDPVFLWRSQLTKTGTGIEMRTKTITRKG